MSLHLNKAGLRALGIAESFVRTMRHSVLAGVVMRADLRVDGLAYARASVGGNDATGAVLDIYGELDRKDINAILLEGAVISWFNIIDLAEVWQKTEKPLICLTYQDSPGLEQYIRDYFPGQEEKLQHYRNLGQRSPIRLKTGYTVYVRSYGADPEEARILLNKFTREGRKPEPLRLASLAARAAHRKGWNRV
jgi:endonuclease V-like protein UPF0215 family